MLSGRGHKQQYGGQDYAGLAGLLKMGRPEAQIKYGGMGGNTGIRSLLDFTAQVVRNVWAYWAEAGGRWGGDR